MQPSTTLQMQLHPIRVLPLFQVLQHYLQVLNNGARFTPRTVLYQVYSTLGQLLKEGQLSTNIKQIDLSNLPANIYYVKIADQTFKVVKE